MPAMNAKNNSLETVLVPGANKTMVATRCLITAATQAKKNESNIWTPIRRSGNANAER
jgi:hypothetical protein